MKALWLKTGSAVTVTALWSIAALAQSSSTVTAPANPQIVGTSTAEATVSSPMRKPLPLSVNSTNIFYGPSLTDPQSGSSADDAIDSLTSLYVRNQIGFGYKLSGKVSIIPTLDFDMVLNRIDKGRTGGFHWRDSFVKVAVPGVYEADLKGNKFAIDTDFRVFVPSSLASRTNNKITAFRVSVNPSVQFGKSPWSLSMVNYARYHVQSKDTNAAGRSLDELDLYTGPQVNYQFNDKITAFVLYETSVTWNKAGIPNTTIPAVSNADVEPGVNLSLHERLSLTPALNWYTNQRLSTTSMLLSASLHLL